MTRLSDATGRLTAGSGTLARRLGSRAASWVARGRRDDLSGWRAVLGCWLRLVLLGFGLYALCRLVRAVPNLMWMLTGWWTIASWRAGKPAAKATPKTVEQASEGTVEALDVEAVRALLLQLMGAGSAVHLRTVLAHLQKHPPTAALTASWTIADLRARLRALDIPVHPKVRAPGGGPTRGVRREDLAPSPTTSGEPSTEPSTGT
ncbi:hypothetical protein [Streptomyces brasiliscabiei]|uniref:hypothetical protein n=1 Tax=Streptomyces brasiliscabiei TaxID=2736302 RepID=UPI001C0FE83F|nr:hypothetical protein [Streptomyces brasiliscabiei]